MKGAPSALKRSWHWGEEGSIPSSAINLLMTSDKLFNLSRLLYFIGVKAACKTSCLVILIEVLFSWLFYLIFMFARYFQFQCIFPIIYRFANLIHQSPCSPHQPRACHTRRGQWEAVTWDNCYQMGAERDQ